MENVIQSTSNYAQFKSLTNNRNISPRHVEDIKIAIEETGNLTKVVPVLVNENYQIIDGQHRFMACQELGMPVYFTMVQGLNIDHARSMNVLQRNWLVSDFAESYANAGNINYKRYLDLKSYGFNHSITLASTLNTTTERQNMFKRFKSGDLEISKEAFDKANKELGQLAEIAQITPVKTKSMGLAFLVAMRSENYDHQTMLTKLKKKADSMESFQTQKDNLRQIEDIYNLSRKIHVRLY